MERKRMKRRIVWDDKGVSEVIGTILTLTITVVLFSSIIMMVGYFPAPGSNVYVTFSGTVDPVDDWTQGAYVNITNTGGVTMTILYTLVYMKVDDTGYNLKARGTYSGTDYGLVDGALDWGAGDTWSFKLAPGEIGPDSIVSIAIIDTNKDTVVWTHDILGGAQSQSPIIVEGWVDSDLNTPRKDPIRFNRDFTFFVKIIDPNDNLDTSSVYVDMSSVGLNTVSQAVDPDGDGIFTNISSMGGHIKVGYYKFRVYASDTSGYDISTTVIVPVGQDIGNVVDLVVDEADITFSKDNPKHGDVIKISSIIKNVGMAFTWADIYFYDMNMTSEPIGHDEILISGVDSQTAFISWRAAPGGEHEIFVEAVVRAPKKDFVPKDNINSTSRTVLPTILLVDDDDHVNDMSTGDTVSYMRAALESCSFTYDYLKVGTGISGPGYNYGDYRLQNYDIVIWMLGYQNTTTFTDDDETNIMKFLTNTSDNRTNTGSMWLIGHGWLEDPYVSLEFKRDYLHVDASSPIANHSTATVEGYASHIITSEWSSDADGTPFEIFERQDGEDKIYNITPTADLTLNTKTEIMLDIDNSNVAINFENYDLDERIVLFPWEFSRIKEPAVQTQMAYKVIKWLGDITETRGKDLAISSQVIYPTYVFYQEYVYINATIRNNGNMTMSKVVAALYIDGNRTVSEISPDILGNGGSWEVSFQWQASVVGTHVMKWIVDPDNLIIETNENNNEVSDYLSTGQLIVEFRILVVDDDDSLNNNGDLFDEAGVVKGVLYDLGYIYENFTVDAADADGPDSDKLAEYSAVIWITGNASSENSLTGTDETSITTYMTKNRGRLWLIGANCLGASVTTEFEEKILGIQSMTGNQSLPGILEGVRDDPITHGMEIQTSGGLDADVIWPITSPGAAGILNSTGQFYGVRYDSGTSVSVVMTMSFMNIWGNDTRYIDGIDARSELTYMIFHWFEKPDLRTELRTTRMDFTMSNAHPVLGDAYVLQVKVHNVGSGVANSLVRFMDGNTQIGADSITIDPGDTTTAEVIWMPLFAGNRTLSVLVDPIEPVSEVEEIFEWFNNNITIPTYVYFFWDDMENRDHSLNKWDHYSTVLNINGENPIDYFTSPTQMDTNVISNWNEAESYGVEEVTDTFHTQDTSYFMEEPFGTFGPPADVLVGIVIDNSPSMVNRICPDGSSRTYLRVVMDAAIGMVNEFTDESAVGVYIFKGANEEQLIQITDLAGTGRQQVIDAINSIKTEQGNTNTAIWDAIGDQYMEVKIASLLPKYVDHYAAVVSLGDGADYQASDDSAYKLQSIESGSDEWAPWGDMRPGDGWPTDNYPNHQGKYWFFEHALPGIWETAGSGAYKPDRRGLLNSDLPIYTIGLALEHYDTPYASEVDPYPGDGISDDNTHVKDTESGTVEYNFWRIADTSEAQYFYSEDGSDLEDIFKLIGQIIGVSGFNQTRAIDDTNVDKRAVTETFSLEGIESAKLSFWHKYNLIQGGNGGFLQVAYKGDATYDGDETDWDYRYIIPPGQYSGGLYFDYNWYDDFETLIKWCWNGLSGGGSFAWDYADVEITQFVPTAYRDEVRIVFNYTQLGGGRGEGWWIDDVKLVVSRYDSEVIDAADKDIWNHVDMTAQNMTAHSGDHAWSNVDPVTDEMKAGIDNSLQTMPVDLTHAQNAYLSAYVKFNINNATGSPPDGFRIEVSTDGGTHWNARNHGFRAISGISTGTGGWDSVGGMIEVNVDLTDFRGYQILLRFRVCTTTEAGYAHYANGGYDGGFYVDDVMIKGESIPLD